MQDFLIVYYQ